MNKKLLIIILIVLVIIIGGIIAFINRKAEKSDYKIIIKYNDFSEKGKEIEIKDKEQIKKLKEFCNKIATTEKADSKLGLLKEIIIEFEDGATITIQTSVNDFCYYKKGDEGKLVKMPDGLLELTKQILKID